MGQNSCRGIKVSPTSMNICHKVNELDCGNLLATRTQARRLELLPIHVGVFIFLFI